MLLVNIILWGAVIIIVVIIELTRAGYQLVTNHTKSVLSSIAIVFIIWLIIRFNIIVAIPIYIVFFLYLGLRFVATNIFVAMDEVFYLGFDVPVIMVWVFWGLVIGAAIQGYREFEGYLWAKMDRNYNTPYTYAFIDACWWNKKCYRFSIFREHNTYCYGAEHR